MKFYITFGQVHRHVIAGQVYDRDCVAEIEARDEDAARKQAFTAFGDKFFTSYPADAFGDKMQYFPRGPIKLVEEDKKNLCFVCKQHWTLLGCDTCARCFDQN